MAINEYMSPAKQNVMNTYVPLPFQEMAAFAGQQKKKDSQGEMLFNATQDSIMGIQAYHPAEKKYLKEYRENVTTQLSDLYNQYNGNYYAMIPELKSIARQVDKDMKFGNLYQIKTNTANVNEYMGAMNKAKSEGKYDDIFNPFLDPGNFNTWIQEGVGSDGMINYEDHMSYNDATGQSTFNPFIFSSLHPHVDHDEETDAIFKDLQKELVETDVIDMDPDSETSGQVIKTKNNSINRARLYDVASKATSNNMASLNSGFRNELNLMLSPEWYNTEEDWATSINEYANRYLKNLFGDQEDGQETIAQVLEENPLTDQNGQPTDAAIAYARAGLLGYMAERFLESDLTFDITSTKGGNTTPGNTGPDVNDINFEKSTVGSVNITVGKPILEETWSWNGEEATSKPERIVISEQEPQWQASYFAQKIKNLKVDYMNIVNEKLNLERTGTLDAKMREDYDARILLAESKMKNYEFSLMNLFQQAASNLDIEANPASMDENGFASQVNLNGVWYDYNNAADRDAFMQNGFTFLQFDEDGDPIAGVGDMQKLYNIAGTADNYAQILTQWDGYFQWVGPGNAAPIYSEMTQIVGDTKPFDGRNYNNNQFKGTGFSDIDKEEAKTYTQILFGEEDHPWVLEDGNTLTSQQVLELMEDFGWGQSPTAENKTLEEDYRIGKNVVLHYSSTPMGAFDGYAVELNIATNDPNKPNLRLYTAATPQYQNLHLNYTKDDKGKQIELSTNQQMVNNSNFLAYLDQSKAREIPGNIIPSNTLRSDGMPVGLYYFGQGPDGEAISLGNNIFVPTKGTIVDYENGQPIYSDGNTFYNGDEVTQLGNILMFNDPARINEAGYWLKKDKKNANNQGIDTEGWDIVPQGQPNKPVTANEMVFDVNDAFGSEFGFLAKKGQTVYDDNHWQTHNLFDVGFGMASGNSVIDSNINIKKPLAEMMKLSFDEVNRVLGSSRMVDGQQINFFDRSDKNGNLYGIFDVLKSFKLPYTSGEAYLNQNVGQLIENGELQVGFVSGGADGFRIPISDISRSYTGQQQAHQEWVDGGKVGPYVAEGNKGFHVIGQAFDISQEPGHYDMAIFDKNGTMLSTFSDLEEVGNDFGNLGDIKGIIAGVVLKSLSQAGSREATRGGMYGTDAFPASDPLSKTRQEDLGYQDNPFGEVYTYEPLLQNPKEWWHFSIGEFGYNKDNLFNTSIVHPDWIKK
jgi:hypothetical protein